ncbi:GNAT family N-acetyltransferase [Kribbella sp. NPDC026611]|uniref:GNAT family N-acetyltransferase n=1 Tax=Kribbella sp. NPDC026611 TaxID=3154911 RepID=UPI003410102C
MADFPDCVPILTDGLPGLVLRPHAPGDIDDFTAMCVDPGYRQWTDKPVPYLRSHAEHFVTELIPGGWVSGEVYGWAIESEGRFAGNIDLGSVRAGGGDVGFGLAPWARGRGLMTRALRLVVGYAFDELAWRVVIWRAVAGNEASRAVARKAGFRRFTTVPDTACLHGERRDEWVASIRPGELLSG